MVSVILTTRDRPRFLAIALHCYQQQKYPIRELIVVDDGVEHPADERVVHSVGGRVIRVAPGTPLGTKLNIGAEASRGVFCQKMDDDDWYGPRYLSAMIGAIQRQWTVACAPTLAFLAPFLFFDLAQWEVHVSASNNVAGATFLFPRDDWQDRPFRALPRDEDVWFVVDQLARGAEPCRVFAPDIYLAVRHAQFGADRGHTWTHQWDGRQLETYLDELPIYRRPEDLLPRWALASYRELHRESALASTEPLAAPAPAQN